MRKSVFLLLVLSILLATPFAVRAQADVTFDKLQVQLWPDYDQASVLVIYDFSVSAETTLPAEISLRLLKGSQLLAVAKEENGALVNLQNQLLEPEGEFNSLSFSVADRSIHHVEFYIPYTRQGNSRSFSFRWTGDYAVKTASVRLQEPIDATDIKTDPVLSPIGKQPDGFVYYARDLNSLSSGQGIVINVSYLKPTDTLSASSLDIQSTQPLDQNIPGQSTYLSYLPWALGGLGVVLLLIAGWVYLASGRAGRAIPRSRKRHVSAASEVSGDDEKQIHCAQCGKRTQPGDRFCRACGARIRRGDG